MVATTQDWLELVQEETLEPDLPICDPHHHLWDHRDSQVEPRYLLEEYVADTETGHNIVSSVFIKCGCAYRAEGPEIMRPVGETEFVVGQAALSASGKYGKTRVAAGIIGSVDFTQGAEVAAALEGHIQAGGGRFRGIRLGVTWDASPEVPNNRTSPKPHLFLDAAYREGVAQLSKYDLSMEGWCYHPQIPELADLARAMPNLRIVFNHLGAPLGLGSYAGRRDEVLEDWKKSVADLAACDNVVAKLGGLNMLYLGFGWHEQDRPPTSEALAEATRPYLEYAIEKFGPDRCMFESNYPVDKVSCGYNVLWNSFKRLTADYSADEKRKLYHDTATAVYRL